MKDRDQEYGFGIFLSSSPHYFLNKSEYDHKSMFLAQVVIGENYVQDKKECAKAFDQICFREDGYDVYFLAETKRILLL